MFYQVRANLYFETEDEAIDFAHDCQIALTKATIVNPGAEEQEVSSWDLLHCNHDEYPNLPCELIDHDDNAPIEP